MPSRRLLIKTSGTHLCHRSWTKYRVSSQQILHMRVKPLRGGKSLVFSRTWPCVLTFPQFYYNFRGFLFCLALTKSFRSRRPAPPTDVASHGSKRRLPWFYFFLKANKLVYSSNLCTEPAAPVNRKINRCTVFVYIYSVWWITEHR